MMKRVIVAFILLGKCMVSYAQETKFEYSISLKSPGNPAKTYSLQESDKGVLRANENVPVNIVQTRTDNGETVKIEVTLTAKEKIYYNFEEICKIQSFNHSDCLFFLPGFWYHKNLRSPKQAPSFATSDSWQVREDRLSSPVTGIYNEKTQRYYTVARRLFVTFGESLLKNYTFRIKPAFFLKAIPTFSRRLYICAFL